MPAIDTPDDASFFKYSFLYTGSPDIRSILPMLRDFLQSQRSLSVFDKIKMQRMALKSAAP